MMDPVTVSIAGRPVVLEWTTATAKRYGFRESKHGGGPAFADFRNKRKAAAAVTRFLWLLLPPEEFALYPTDEDLFVAIDHEKEAAGIHSALMAIMGEMLPSPEKKSTTGNSPSPASSSA